jgi:hypothetical protein
MEDYDDAASLVTIGAIIIVPLAFIPLFIILFRLLKRLWRNTKEWQEREKHGLEYIEKSLSTSIFHHVLRAERKNQFSETTFHSKNWREVSEIQHSSAFLSSSWVSNYMVSSLVGYIWVNCPVKVTFQMIFQIIVNLVAVATYVAELQFGFNPLWLVGIEYFVTICFTIDYLIFFYAAADKYYIIPNLCFQAPILFYCFCIIRSFHDPSRLCINFIRQCNWT